MTIWQLEQESQIGWKKKTQKKSTKNNFYFFLFFFQGTNRIRTWHFGFLSAPILWNAHLTPWLFWPINL